MQLWRKFSVGQKIFSGFIIVLAVVALSGGSTFFQTYTTEANTTNLADNLAQDLHTADAIDTGIWRLRFYAAQYIAVQDQSILVNYQDEYTNFVALMDKASQQITSPERKAMVEEIQKQNKNFNDAIINIGDIIFRRKTVVDETLNPQGTTAVEGLQNIRRAAYNNGEGLTTYYAGNASEYMQLAQTAAAKYIATGDDKYMSQFHQRYEQTITAMNRLKRELTDSNRKQMVDESIAAFNSYADTLNGLVDDYATQQVLVTKMNVSGLAISNKSEEIVSSMNDEFQTTLTETHKASAGSRTFIAFAVIITLLSGLALAWLITRSVTAPIKAVTQASVQLAEGKIPEIESSNSRDELGIMTNAFGRMVGYLNGMADVAQAIASGDISVDVMPYSDEDLLGNALAGMVDSMRNLVGQVKATSVRIAESSEQLAQTAAESVKSASQVSDTLQQVAQGSAQQAAGMTQATGSVEQVSRAVNGVALGAQEQAEAAGKTATLTMQVADIVQTVASSAQAGSEGTVNSMQTATAGAETIRLAIENMNAIREAVELIGSRVQDVNTRSNQIGAIVETIDDIAAQTNLLALNAAIEAARAGEHGKGFAVVADEVRKLAEKSASATGEIASLVKGIQSVTGEASKATENGVKAVAVGVEQMGTSGEALESIVTSAEAVNNLMADIAAAAEQMQNASDELVSSVETVSAVIEENTASTEEMAASSAEVMDVMENIASISEENSAAVEQVSAAAQEMNAQMHGVAGAAQELDRMAQELQQVVATFKLEAEDGISEFDEDEMEESLSAEVESLEVSVEEAA